MKLTPLQAQVDAGVGTFLESALDGKSLAAMTMGGLAFRAGRIGVMGISAGAYGRMPLQIASVAAGLAAEVSVFELSHRAIESLNPPNPPLTKGGEGGFSNLWRWKGSGGLRQDLLQSLVTFGALKGAGRLTRGENRIAQHLFQDSAMVLGHQLTGAFGVAPRPTGSLAEQFLQAESANLQMGAGLSLGRGLFPGIHSFERSLDLSLQFQIPLHPSFSKGEIQSHSPLKKGGWGDFDFAIAASRFPFPETSAPKDFLDPKGSIVLMSEGEEGPKKREWFSLPERKEENPWKGFSIRRLIEKSRGGELEAAKELARRVYTEPRDFYQKFELMRILEGLAEVRDEAIAQRFIAVLHVLANASPGVFDREHVSLLKGLAPVNPEAQWILSDLHASRPDLRETIPPPEPSGSDKSGEIVRLPWIDPLQRERARVEDRAKQLFKTLVDRIRVSADSIEFVGIYYPAGGLVPVSSSYPQKESKADFPDPVLKILFTNAHWTQKIEGALQASEKGGKDSVARLTRVLQEYVDEPAVEFSHLSDSRYARLQGLLGLADPRLGPALKHLETPWLIEISKSQILALQGLGRLAERQNRKALHALVDLSNGGYASALGILNQVEMRDLIRTAMNENDGTAASDAARFAETGVDLAVNDLFSLAKAALLESKNEAAFAALKSLLDLFQSKKQDGPFFHLVVAAPELFRPLEEEAREGRLEEPWLELLKEYGLVGHYGALDLLADSAARQPSARRRLMEVQKAIPKEDFPEIFEFRGRADLSEIEELQRRMRLQKIRKTAVVRLVVLLGRPR